MKKRDVEKVLQECGWRQISGGKHDKWTNGTISIAVPRHKEINEFTAKGIVKTVRAHAIKK